MTAPRPQSRQPKQLDAGALQAEISSFRLRLAAEGKGAKTIRTYTEAVQWLAAASLLPTGKTAWGQVDGQDAQLVSTRRIEACTASVTACSSKAPPAAERPTRPLPRTPA